MKPRCVICGKIINAGNRVKSHALTKSVYSGRMAVEDGEHIISLAAVNGEISEGDYGHGETEKNILCRGCDSMLSPAEQVRDKFLLENNDLYLANCGRKILTGYDWKKIKLAFLADIFRCSCFKGGYFSGVDIGDYHTARIREMLSMEDAGEEDDYTIWLVKYDMKDFPPDICMCPAKRKFEGCRFYVCLMPYGWLWIIKMDRRYVWADRFASFTPNGVAVYDGGVFEKSGPFGAVVEMVRKNEIQKFQEKAFKK